MIAMGGLGENKWDGLGQCLHTPTILQGDEKKLNANCFHQRYQRRHCRHHHERYQRPHIPRIAQHDVLLNANYYLTFLQFNDFSAALSSQY